MEPAKIDWTSIDSVFVEDDVYENISAPQWVDFSAPDPSVNDEDWFCRPDCNHPKKAEDFLKSTATSKMRSLRFADVGKILSLGDRNQRDANLRKRGTAQSPIPSTPNTKLGRSTQDGENHNPNLCTPPRCQASRFMKTTTKSSNENTQYTIDDTSQSSSSETPWLKRTLSARNVFAGRDILNHITDFCHELKRLAVRTKDRQNEEDKSAQKTLVGRHRPVVVKEVEREVLVELNHTKNKEKERKPLLEMNTHKGEPMEKSNGQQRRIKAENAPPPTVDLKNVKRKEESLLQIRLNPPSPQCFSGSRGTTKVTPFNPSRCKPVDRGVFQELGQSNEGVRKTGDKGSAASAKEVPAVTERGLDVFWFLKPCRLST